MKPLCLLPLCLLMVLAVCCPSTAADKSSSPTSDSSKSESIKAQATRMYSTYHDSQANGDKQWGDKLLSVLCHVSTITKQGDIYVLYCNPSPEKKNGSGVYFYFAKGQEEKLADLKPGQQIWVQGTVKSYDSKTDRIIINGCVFQREAGKDDAKQFDDK
jgi:hypothetical protein